MIIHRQTPLVQSASWITPWPELLNPSSPRLPAVVEAARRGVLLVERQSSAAQVEKNIGSQLAQREYIDHAIRSFVRHGVPHSSIRIVSALGESGSRGRARPRFEELMIELAADRAGVLVFPEHHRIGRNLGDAERLFELAARHGAFIFVAAEMYDPGHHEDRMRLQNAAAGAQHMVASQIDWSNRGKLALARKGALRTPLPSVLAWCPAEQPAFRRLAVHAGLEGWLKTLHLHRTVSVDRNGIRHWILPEPDPAVIRTAELRFQWLFQTESVDEVLRRIREDPAWPAGFAGRVPVYGSSLWIEGRTPRWLPVARRSLIRWFKNPAWAGIYCVKVRALEDKRLTYERSKYRGWKGKGPHFGRAQQQALPQMPTAMSILGFDRFSQE